MTRFALVLIVVMAVYGAADAQVKFDEYGAINCEEEWARLANFATKLKATDMAQGVVIVYAGRRGSTRDQVHSRISFIKHYLTVSRSIERRRLTIYDGGFREAFTTQLWIIPSGADAKPLILPTVMPKDVRFKRGRAGNRTRYCSVIG